MPIPYAFGGPVPPRKPLLDRRAFELVERRVAALEHGHKDTQHDLVKYAGDQHALFQFTRYEVEQVRTIMVNQHKRTLQMQEECATLTATLHNVLYQNEDLRQAIEQIKVHGITQTHVHEITDTRNYAAAIAGGLVGGFTLLVLFTVWLKYYVG